MKPADPGPVETTRPAQSESVSLQIDLPHAPEKVWRALTDPSLLSQWLLPIRELPLELGGKFAFLIPAEQGWGSVVDCRLLESHTQRKLSYTWSVDDLDTVVTFTLTPIPSGTRLVLEQTGFRPGQSRYFGGARYGWKKMAAQLLNLLGRIS